MNVGLELARSELKQRRWKDAYAYAEASRSAEPQGAELVMAEASARQARRAALWGRFAEARQCAARAIELRPHEARYQRQRHLISRAAAAVIEAHGEPLFGGLATGHWWEADFLALVRGWDGSGETVSAPIILQETARTAVADVYALGAYQPWHVAGPEPLFTSYIKAFKRGGKTIPIAAMLLRQGLVLETEWIEEVDVIVPMATSLRSFEARGFELTEELADELGLRLCLPVVDVFEVDPQAGATHQAGGYADRARTLAGALRVKRDNAAVLESAEGVLVIDDVVTYGSTFEACAHALQRTFGVQQVYGAALAYTDTPQRRARALIQRDDVEGLP